MIVIRKSTQVPWLWVYEYKPRYHYTTLNKIETK